MIELVNKLSEIEQDVSASNGEFALFALFLRADSPNRWDLVVAAPWIDTDPGVAQRILLPKLRSQLSPQQLLLISRVVEISCDNPELSMLHRAIKAHHARVEVQSSTFFGLRIQHAYIITCQGVEAALPKDAGPRRGP